MPTVPPNQPGRILVIRTDRIGDTLLSTPALSALRERYPASRIAMLVTPYTQQVIAGHPALDGTLIDDRTGLHRGLAGFLRLAKTLRNECFDTAIVLHPTLRLALLCLLCGIPTRVGTGYRAYSFLFNRRVYEHRKDARRHEVALNLSLVFALTGEVAKPEPILIIPDEAHNVITKRLGKWGIGPDEPVVTLHPGSGGSARSWPAASYARLGQKLMDMGIRVVLTGGPGERPLVEGIAVTMTPPPFVTVDDLTIKELAALLAKSRLCITNSTGPLHMAAAVKTPTVALFCPITPCSPTRWGPYGDGHVVMQPDVPACPKCIETACPYFDCMERISVDSVFQAAQEILAATDRPVVKQTTPRSP